MRNIMRTIGLAILLLAASDAAATEDGKKLLTPEQRMLARYPQPVRAGDLIGLPLLDDNHSTLGHVREVVRTDGNKIELIADYGGFLGAFGWATRPVAVPIEVVGIRGRELVSLDMPRREYATAPIWHANDAVVLPRDASIGLALCRGY
jgi:PRC-barrel domain